MSEHSIKCSYDDPLLYETRLCSLELQGMAIYISQLYTPAAGLCKVKTATRLFKFFYSSLPECL